MRLIQSAAMTAVGLVDSPSYDAPVEVRARGHERRHRRRMAVMITPSELRGALGADAKRYRGGSIRIYAAVLRAHQALRAINAPVESPQRSG